MSQFSIFKQIEEIPDDIIEHDLYNDKNILIKKDEVEKILKHCELNLEIQNLQLYQRAFTHKSYIVKEECVKIVENKINALELQPKSYERLEFLGDSVLGSIVVTYLFKRFFDQNEGTMTKYKARLVSKNALSSFARMLNFGPFLIISKQIEENNGRNNINILEDTFEAFIGAMLLDFENQYKKGKINISGYEVCEKFILYIIENEIDIERLVLQDTNYKEQLLKYYQQNYQKTPKYKKLDNQNKKIFCIAVLDIEDNIFATGIHTNKKRAEQLASKNALIKLNIIDPEILDEDYNEYDIN